MVNAGKSMKNTLIVILTLLVVAMPVTYLVHRHKIIKQNAARMAKKKAIGWHKKNFKYEISTGDSSAKGYLLIAPYQGRPNYGFGYLTIMDMAGRVIYRKAVENALYDFRQWKLGGKIYYSYMTDDSDVFHCSGFNLADGHVTILDSVLNPVKEVHLLPYDDVNRDRKNDLDVHDFIMLSEDHFITMVNYEKHVTNIPSELRPAPGIKVGACIIQEQDHGKVVWQWDATHYPELYKSSVDHNNFGDTSMTQDYAHFNAIVLDPRDSNIIVSFRGFNQLIKVNRKTGEIMWRLGGENSDFPLSTEQVFLGQHGINLTDDNQTLLMLDNGDEKKRFYSRVLEFRLDEKNKRVSSFMAYKIPHAYAIIQGNVSKVDGNYLISGGSAKYTLLVDPKTDKYLFEMRQNLPSYRVYKADSIYGLEKKQHRP